MTKETRMSKDRLKEIGNMTMHSKDINAFGHAVVELYNELIKTKEDLEVEKVIRDSIERAYDRLMTIIARHNLWDEFNASAGDPVDPQYPKCAGCIRSSHNAHCGWVFGSRDGTRKPKCVDGDKFELKVIERPKLCPKCGGLGQVEWAGVWKECTKCHGKKYLPNDNKKVK